MPAARRLMPQGAEPLVVTTDSEIGVMPLEHLSQTLVLVSQQPVSHLAALLVDRLERTRKAVFCRDLPHHRRTLPRAPPYVAEAQEVKARGHALLIGVSARLPNPKVDHAGLLRMQLQAVLVQPFREYRQYAFR